MLLSALNGQQRRMGLLPQDLPNRDDFIGISISRRVKESPSTSVRFSISQSLLSRVGNPKKLEVRGTPENGYFLTGGKNGVRPARSGPHRWYVFISALKVNAPRDERQTVWLRAEIDAGRIRIPPLPAAWIAGEPEFMPGTQCEEGPRGMRVSKTAGDEPVRSTPSPAVPMATTVPPPKAVVDYKLPDNISIGDAQALLGRKLDEARAVMREL